jgi:membrane-associated phospholipid phosphatase
MALSGYVVVTVVLIAWGLAVTGWLESSAIGRLDESVTSWLAGHRVAQLDAVTGLVSRSADTLGAVGAAVVVAATLALARRWRWIAALVLGLVLELAVFLTVNLVVDRPRPDVDRIASTPSTSSFPSGHTAAATVIYVLIACCVTVATTRRVIRSLAWIGAVLMPAAVGFSRVYRGLHHPDDVLAGFVMGIGVLIVALAAVCAHTRAAAPPARRDAEEGREIARLQGAAS